MAKIVLVGGCFDLIHFGHISFLTQAKQYGDHLIVALESDGNVQLAKGPARPIHTQQQRKEMLLAIKVVDEVVELPLMTRDEEYFALIKKIKPDIIALTEGDPLLEKKMEQAKQNDAEVVIISKVRSPSTSQLAKLLDLE